MVHSTLTEIGQRSLQLVMPCLLGIWLAPLSALAQVGGDGQHGRMVDALGDTLPQAPYPTRIISLSPSLTECLYAAGVSQARIVGVTRFCDVPPEAKERPIIGGIIDPSLEKIQIQRPDLVLAVRGTPVETLHQIRSLGIPVFAFDDRCGLEGIRTIVSTIVALTGPEDVMRSDALLRRFWWELRAYRVWSDSIPEAQRPRVYYTDPEHPAWTAGPGSHLDDLIRLAGGVNIVKEGGGWPQYSTEMLLSAAPDRLLLALPAGADTSTVLRNLRALPGWSSLQAVRAGSICWVDAGTLLRPGPRVLTALEEIAACLHPDRPRPGPKP